MSSDIPRQLLPEVRGSSEVYADHVQQTSSPRPYR